MSLSTFPVCRTFFIALCTLCLLTVSVSAQVSSDRQLTVRAADAVEGQPVEITIETSPTLRINRAIVLYRVFGSSEFANVEATPQGGKFIARIPARVVLLPSVEYYVSAVLADQSVITFPQLSPAQNPASLTVRPKPENPDVFVVSPTPGETVPDDELLISFSFYRVSAQANKSTASLLLDGVDVTRQALISDNLVTYIPSPAMRAGRHRADFEIRAADGRSFGIVSTFFTVRSTAVSAGTSGVDASPEPVKYTSQNWIELRNETVANTGTFYGRGNVAVDGSYKWFGFGGQLYLTNEERTDAQPRNRFMIKATSPWLDVRFGDNFPDYNTYITNGLRVRGLEANAHVNAAKVDVIQGFVNREIDAQYGDTRTFVGAELTDSAQVITNLAQTGYVLTDSTATSKTFRLLNRTGAYNRKLFTTRFGFENERGALLFQYLRSADEPGGRSGIGAAPQENSVVGATLKANFLPGQWDAFGDVAFSLSNKDISRGRLTETQFDAITGNQGVVEDINSKFPGGFDGLNSLITINENLFPFFPLDFSSLVYRIGTNVNLNNKDYANFLRAEFLRQGQSYQSFGLAYYQPDITGLRITDRLRLIENKLIISLGFENLYDNLLKQRDRIIVTGERLDATTQRLQLRGAVSVFPDGNIPNVRVEYSYQSNQNRFPTTFNDRIVVIDTAGVQDTVTTLAVLQSGINNQINNTTNTFIFDVSKSFPVAAQTQLSAGLTGTSTDRKDNRDLAPKAGVFDTAAYRFAVPQNFSSFSLTLNSSLSLPNSLRATVGFTTLTSSYFTAPELKASQTINSLDVGVGYAFVNGTVRPSLRTSFTFGDFPRTLIGLSADYDITPAMLLAFEGTLINIGQPAVSTGFPATSYTDAIVGVRYQMTFGN